MFLSPMYWLAYCHQPGTNPDSVTVTEKCLKENPKNTLTDSGPLAQKSRFATTRPTRQIMVKLNKITRSLPQVQPELSAINGKVVMYDVRLMLLRMMKVPSCARMPMRMGVFHGVRDQLAM